MKNVESIEELEDELKKALKSFMEENEQFNVQGEFQGENGITVNALIDFGIEDRDNGSYYVGSVSAQLDRDENLEYLDEKGLISENKPIDEVEPEKLIEEIAESEVYEDVENAIKSAIKQVFDVSHRRTLTSRPDVSDVDINTIIPIYYGNWKTQEEVKV